VRYRVGGHGKRVYVALFRRVAVREAELRWVQQLWGHVMSSRYGIGHGAALHDSRIDGDFRDSKASEACVTLLSDQDVSLDGLKIGKVAVFGTLYLSPE